MPKAEARPTRSWSPTSTRGLPYETLERCSSRMSWLEQTSGADQAGQARNQPGGASSQPDRSPCAACKFLRRKCTDECLFAPHFPQSEMEKFLSLHRCYGAANIIKLLSGLPKDLRGDAVQSLAYEAQARIADPVYGCVGAIAILQKQIDRLTAELNLERASLAGLTAHLHSQHHPSPLGRISSPTPPNAAKMEFSAPRAPSPVQIAAPTPRGATRTTQDALNSLLAGLTSSFAPPALESPLSGQTYDTFRSHSTYNTNSTTFTNNSGFDSHPFNPRPDQSNDPGRLGPAVGAPGPVRFNGASEVSDPQLGDPSDHLGDAFKFQPLESGFGSPLGPLEYNMFKSEDSAGFYPMPNNGNYENQ